MITVKIYLLDMEIAPKDGTHIIVKGVCLDSDIIAFHEAWWWKPTTLQQWENGARPHWETIIKNTCYGVVDIKGWIPLPIERIKEAL